MPLRRAAAGRARVALLAALGASGCSSWNTDGALFGVFTPHRIDIQQGNVVTEEQLALVRPGMNRLQVRDVLGTPLLTDTFHPERWDYIFTLRQSGRPLQRRNIVLIFEGEVLKSIDAPELPTEREFIDSISRTGRVVAASQLELTPDQVKALPVPARAPAPPPADAPAAVPRNYPPLEPS